MRERRCGEVGRDAALRIRFADRVKDGVSLGVLKGVQQSETLVEVGRDGGAARGVEADQPCRLRRLRRRSTASAANGVEVAKDEQGRHGRKAGEEHRASSAPDGD